MKSIFFLLFVIISVITRRQDNRNKKKKKGVRVIRIPYGFQINQIKDSMPVLVEDIKKATYKLPENLSDGNQDGFADEGDFIRSFNNIVKLNNLKGMSPWELKQLFMMADSNGNGQLDTQEWRNFHTMFVQKFQLADKDQNLSLNVHELTKSFGDTAQLKQIINDKTTFQRLVNDITGRQNMKENDINFFEWMFLRRCAIAWGISNSRQNTISKSELLDSAMTIMLPFNPHNSQLKNIIYQTLDYTGSNVYFSFLDMVNIFHKFLIFTSMLQHSSIQGVLPIPSLRRAIDDGIGPSEIFLINSQTKQDTINQAFALREDEEEIGIDFQQFYDLMKVINSVKFYAKTQQNCLNFKEYNDLISKEENFGKAFKLMENSYVQNGDYLKKYNFTLESEAYVLSNSKFNPVQNRFLQINPYKIANKNLKQRLQKKLKQSNQPEKKTYKLDQNALLYFFQMFQSNEDQNFINYGDLFRIKKYSLIFSNWDNNNGLSTKTVYPEILDYKQLNVFPTIVFLREKEIIRDMQELYKTQKQLDHVQVSLPVDFLGFCRFMAYDQLQRIVSKAKVGEEIAYSSLYKIFSKMGLIPYNMDMNNWLRTIFQGQRGFQIFDKEGEILEQGRNVINGFEQFKLASIRASKQLHAQEQFGNEWEYMDPVIYSSDSKQFRMKKQRKFIYN